MCGYTVKSNMYLFILINIILCFAVPGTVLAANDALASGQEIRQKFNVRAKDELVCPYYATLCKLGKEYCSSKSKNCEKVLLSGEKTLLDVCCAALHDSEILDRSGVHEACQVTYGTIDLWPPYCTGTTTGASTSHKLPPTDIVSLDKNTYGSDEPRNIRIVDKVHLKVEGETTHNEFLIGHTAAIVVATVSVVFNIALLWYVCILQSRIKKITGNRQRFIGTDVNSHVENTAENNNNNGNKQNEQTDVSPSSGNGINALHLQNQGQLQAIVAQETRGGSLAGAGSSEPSGASMTTPEEEDATETSPLTELSGTVDRE